MCRYTEIIRDIYEDSVSVVYESPSGDMICFDYTHMQQGAANIIAPGDDEILDVIDYVVSMIYYASPTSLLVVSTHCYSGNSSGCRFADDLCHAVFELRL